MTPRTYFYDIKGMFEILIHKFLKMAKQEICSVQYVCMLVSTAKTENFVLRDGYIYAHIGINSFLMAFRTYLMLYKAGWGLYIYYFTSL